jgi:hypothetical protein
MTATCRSCGHTETEVGKIGSDCICDLCYRAQRDEKGLVSPQASLRGGEERRWE